MKCEQPPVPLKTAVILLAQGIPKTGGTGAVSGDIQGLKYILPGLGALYKVRGRPGFTLVIHKAFSTESSSKVCHTHCSQSNAAADAPGHVNILERNKFNPMETIRLHDR